MLTQSSQKMINRIVRLFYCSPNLYQIVVENNREKNLSIKDTGQIGYPCWKNELLPPIPNIKIADGL